MPYQAPAPTAPEHKKVGPIIAILIIILVLIIGALYLFASRINTEQAPVDSSVAASDTAMPLQNNASNSAPSTVQPVTGTSDDLGSLEADLKTSAGGIDSQNF